MNKLALPFAAALVALSGFALAQDRLPDPGNDDAARQARMDAAYRDHREGKAERAEDTVKRDARETGHAIHRGAQRTGAAVDRGATRAGHAIHRGATRTGHAIKTGAHRTGEAVDRGVQKVKGE
jgi:hypothetical protein